MLSATYCFIARASSKQDLRRSILDAFKRIEFDISNLDDLNFYISRFFRDISPDFSSPYFFEFCSDRVATVCIEPIPFGFEFSIRVEY